MVDNMIILFESTDLEFETNGLGRLIDAGSCVVTEERNGLFELELTYPIFGRHYDEIKMRRIIVAPANPYSGPQAFRIYSISKPINGIVTVNAEHISYDLTGYPVSPFTAASAGNAFALFTSNVAVPCPFQFWTDLDTAATMTVLKPSSIRSLLGGTEGSILDVYGGEYEFDNFLVRLYHNRGNDRGVSIRYGKNLTDLKQEENCSSVYTGVYPYWYSEQSGLIQLPEKILHAEGTYNYERILSLDLSSDFQEAPSVDDLRNRAEQYMTNNRIGVPKVSITVSFTQLAQSEEYENYAILETVHLCDTVSVEFPKLGVDATAKCISTKYDVLTGKYLELELGDVRSKLGSTIAGQIQSIQDARNSMSQSFRDAYDYIDESFGDAYDYVDETNRNTLNRVDELLKNERTFMEEAVDTATKKITGGMGGYVVIRSSIGADNPDEILIMDTSDIKTAKRVWRWNRGGLGYSDKGYNGPYTTAITQDGLIVADFIRAGEIQGIVITGNTIQTAKKGKRIMMDTSSALKGFDDTILVNIIDMSSEGNENQMTIDAKNAAAIRTPKLYVIDKSYGTSGGDAKVSKTGFTNYITNVTKNYSGEGAYSCKEVWVEGVYCTLPVFLNVTTSTFQTIHGMLLSDEPSVQTNIV